MNMSSDDQYGFPGEDWGEDDDSEWGEDLNKDSSEGGYTDEDSLPLPSLDYNDPLLYQDQPSYYPSLSSVRTSTSQAAATTPSISVTETLKQGLEDPTIRQEMLRVISKRKGKIVSQPGSRSYANILQETMNQRAYQFFYGLLQIHVDDIHVHIS